MSLSSNRRAIASGRRRTCSRNRSVMVALRQSPPVIGCPPRERDLPARPHQQAATESSDPPLFQLSRLFHASRARDMGPSSATSRYPWSSRLLIFVADDRSVKKNSHL